MAATRISIGRAKRSSRDWGLGSILGSDEGKAKRFFPGNSEDSGVLPHSPQGCHGTY